VRFQKTSPVLLLAPPSHLPTPSPATTEVIVITIAVVSLIVDDHVVQGDASTHDQIKNALRVKPVRNG
jgi:hypothetical protein